MVLYWNAFWKSNQNNWFFIDRVQFVIELHSSQTPQLCSMPIKYTELLQNQSVLVVMFIVASLCWNVLFPSKTEVPRKNIILFCSCPLNPQKCVGKIPDFSEYPFLTMTHLQIIIIIIKRIKTSFYTHVWLYTSILIVKFNNNIYIFLRKTGFK